MAIAPQRAYVHAARSGSSFMVTGQRQSCGGHGCSPSATDDETSSSIDRSGVGTRMVSGLPTSGALRGCCAPPAERWPAGARGGSGAAALALLAALAAELPASAASRISVAVGSWPQSSPARAASALDAGPKSAPATWTVEPPRGAALSARAAARAARAPRNHRGGAPHQAPLTALAPRREARRCQAG
jgi:hypothetical protein